MLFTVVGGIPNDEMIPVPAAKAAAHEAKEAAEAKARATAEAAAATRAEQDKMARLAAEEGAAEATLRTRTESRVTASIVPRRQFVPRCTNFLGSILRFCLLATMLVACAGTARSDSACN